VGRELHCRPDQWDLPAADILPAVPPMSSLFPAGIGHVQGQIPQCFGTGCQAGVAINPRTPHKCQRL